MTNIHKKDFQQEIKKIEKVVVLLETKCKKVQKRDFSLKIMQKNK
jgi:hypothetical protein